MRFLPRFSIQVENSVEIVCLSKVLSLPSSSVVYKFNMGSLFGFCLFFMSVFLFPRGRGCALAVGIFSVILVLTFLQNEFNL